MAAYGNTDFGIAGSIWGREASGIDTRLAAESIGFGVPLFVYPGDATKVYAPHQDTATLTLAGDLVGSNVITTTINGTAIATTYVTSSAATVTAHIAAINANDTMIALGITATAGSTALKIVINGVGKDITSTAVVTLGDGQVASVTVYTSAAKFAGVSVASHRSFVDSAGVYPIGDAVNVMYNGRILVAVPSGATLYANKLAYTPLLNTGTDWKKFTNTSTDYDTGCVFMTNPLNGLAVLEVRGLK